MNYYHAPPQITQSNFYPNTSWQAPNFLNEYQICYLYNQNYYPELRFSAPQQSIQADFSSKTEIDNEDEKKQVENEEAVDQAQKDEKKDKKMEYIGRNDFSNMFKSFFFLVFKCDKTKAHIKDLIKKLGLSISLDSFSKRLKRRFPESKSYIGPKQIRSFFWKLQNNQLSVQKSTCLLFKLLLRQFLQKEYKLYVIKKYKGKNQSKKQIFSKCRVLHQQLFGQQAPAK